MKGCENRRMLGRALWWLYLRGAVVVDACQDGGHGRLGCGAF